MSPQIFPASPSLSSEPQNPREPREARSPRDSRKPRPSPEQHQQPSPSTIRSQTYTTLQYLLPSYLLLTSALMFRTSRSPLPQRQKWAQYETILKGTTLGAVVVGVAFGGGWGKRRSEVLREHEHKPADQSGVGIENRSRGTRKEGLSEERKEEARRMVREGGVQRD